MAAALDAVVCDFLAIYHLRIDPESDDFAGLTGFQFLRYAYRLPSYTGAVAALVAAVRDDSPDAPAASQQMVPGTALALQAHPDFSALIDFN